MATAGATPTPTIPEATLLAVERTRLAHERTLMAWVRTATSLISFGFTIFKFFQYLHGEGMAEKPPQILGARHFALLMISTGLIALVIATIQHRASLRALRAQFQPKNVPYSLAAVMAEGTTVLRNAASEPHVQDLARMMVALGARIDGIGSNCYVTEGNERLQGGSYRLGPDHIEIASFIGLAAVTNGSVVIEDVRGEDLRSTLMGFERLGIRPRLDGSHLHVDADQERRIRPDLGGHVPKLEDGPWPAFPADAMSIVNHTLPSAAVLSAVGVSIGSSIAYSTKAACLDGSRSDRARLATPIAAVAKAASTSARVQRARGIIRGRREPRAPSGTGGSTAPPGPSPAGAPWLPRPRERCATEKAERACPRC